MKYYANFNVNNGTSWMNGSASNNKWELLKKVRETALSERFPGNKCHIWVKDSDGLSVFDATAWWNDSNLKYSVYNYKEKD